MVLQCSCYTQRHWKPNVQSDNHRLSTACNSAAGLGTSTNPPKWLSTPKNSKDSSLFRAFAPPLHRWSVLMGHVRNKQTKIQSLTLCTYLAWLLWARAKSSMLLIACPLSFTIHTKYMQQITDIQKITVHVKKYMQYCIKCLTEISTWGHELLAMDSQESTQNLLFSSAMKQNKSEKVESE